MIRRCLYESLSSQNVANRISELARILRELDIHNDFSATVIDVDVVLSSLRGKGMRLNEDGEFEVAISVRKSSSIYQAVKDFLEDITGSAIQVSGGGRNIVRLDDHTSITDMDEALKSNDAVAKFFIWGISRVDMYEDSGECIIVFNFDYGVSTLSKF